MTARDYPRWHLGNVYPGLGSEQFERDRSRLVHAIEELETLADELPAIGASHQSPASIQDLGDRIGALLGLLNEGYDLFLNLSNYVYSFVDTDTNDDYAKKRLSELEPLQVKLDLLLDARFRVWLASLAESLPMIVDANSIAGDHLFFLTEAVSQGKYTMPAPEEQLAGELSLSGTVAWSKLQAEITSQLKWKITDETGQEQVLPITAIMNLAQHPDESSRRRGYEAEMEAWETVEGPLAAALNGVKGAQLTLFSHRGREDPIHDSLDRNRIDRATLDTMLGVIRESLPLFRRYLLAKAARLGKTALPWWDRQAPTVTTGVGLPYEQAQAFLLNTLLGFSEDLAGVARRAFNDNWIDVGPRAGKVPNGYCMYLPIAGESRILLNYEENLPWLFTLAHELGHAFHNHCLKGRTYLQRRTPMTLAETASIMCETVVTSAAIENTYDRLRQLAILEASLDSAVGNVAGVYCWYLFEAEVFKRRAVAQLPPAEFNAIMEWAQGEAFGNALHEDHRFKYLWAWPPHFYIPDLSFYSYPYAFGLLFGIGLFEQYRQRGDAFLSTYRELLSRSGMARAEQLADASGMDIRLPEFWRGGIRVLDERITRYITLAGAVANQS